MLRKFYGFLIMSEKIRYKDFIFKKYISSTELSVKIKEIANFINKDNLSSSIFIGVLDGSARFMMELLRNIEIPYELGFMKVKSYDYMKKKSLKLELDINKRIVENKNVYLIEDIIDSGDTIKYLYNHISSFNPKSIKVISLLIKNEEISPCDYYGFAIENNFVIGYGMDINNLFRYLNDIYILDNNEK